MKLKKQHYLTDYHLRSRSAASNYLCP